MKQHLYTAKKVFYQEGLTAVSKRALSRASKPLFCNGPLDDLAFRLSLSILDRMKDSEQSIEDVLDTAYGYRGLGKYNSIDPIQHRAELKELINIVDRISPSSMLEIGTARGGTLYSLCRSLDSLNNVVSLDIGMVEHYQDRLKLYNEFEESVKFQFIVADSQPEKSLQRVRKVAEPIDFIFIDADHSYNAVNKEFDLYRPLVSDGGIMAFHDVRNPNWDRGVGKFWDEIEEEFETTVINKPSTDVLDAQISRNLGIGVVHF